MEIALIVAAVLLAAAAILAVVLPLRIRVTTKGRGQFGDTWVIAGGVELFLVTISFAAAHAAPSVIQVHVARRRVWSRRGGTPREPSGPPMTLERLVDKAERAWAELNSRFDRDQLGRYVLGLRRYVRLQHCRGHLVYATPDVAVTGMLSGALYFVAGLLSPLGTFAVTPEWEDVLRVQGDIDIAVKVWPVRAATNIAWFVTRNMRSRDEVEEAPADSLPART